MKVDVVADIGNTRIKWGRSLDGKIADVAAVSSDDPATWDKQMLAWGLGAEANWAVASVVPERSEKLARWIRQQKGQVCVVDDPRQLPLRVNLEKPEAVGIDRLLDAVAANARRRKGVAAVIVDAGSAVTVDAVDEGGAFEGGAIFPGFGLMAQALHEHTALLPLIQIHEIAWPPAKNTRAAMELGVYWAVVGGIDMLVRHLASRAHGGVDVFLTGGDAGLIARSWGYPHVVWLEMTLEGIRLAAEAQP